MNEVPKPIEQGYSQNYIDAMYASRTISDSELIKGGAIYINGVLVVTEQQIEIERSRFLNNVGVIVLHSETEEENSKPITSLINEANNRKTLEDGITQTLEPYAGLFTDRLPPSDSNVRNWRGKLKTSMKSIPIWKTRKVTNGVEAEYDFSLRYSVGETLNTIEEVSVNVNQISAPEDKSKSTLSLNYTNGRVSSIEFGSFDARKDFDQCLLGITAEEPSPLGTFIANATDRGYLTIELNDERPRIILSPTETSYQGCEYRYDPQSDCFNLIGSQGFTVSSFFQGNRDVTRPKTVSNKEFLEILEATLQLIPTTKIS